MTDYLRLELDKVTAKVTLEITFSPAVKFRIWLAVKLVHLARRIAGFNLEFKRA